MKKVYQLNEFSDQKVGAPHGMYSSFDAIVRRLTCNGKAKCVILDEFGKEIEWPENLGGRIMIIMKKSTMDYKDTPEHLFGLPESKPEYFAITEYDLYE